MGASSPRVRKNAPTRISDITPHPITRLIQSFAPADDILSSTLTDRWVRAAGNGGTSEPFGGARVSIGRKPRRRRRNPSGVTKRSEVGPRVDHRQAAGDAVSRAPETVRGAAFPAKFRDLTKSNYLRDVMGWRRRCRLFQQPVRLASDGIRPLAGTAGRVLFTPRGVCPRRCRSLPLHFQRRFSALVPHGARGRIRRGARCLDL